MLGIKSCKVTNWTMNPLTGVSEVQILVPKGLLKGLQDLKVINKVGEDTAGFTIP